MKWLLIGLLLWPGISEGQDLEHRFQHDYFRKENACGGKLESQLQALWFSFEHPALKARASLIANVTEQASGFTQTLIYNTKNWFYPSFNGHHEFHPVDCDKRTCRAEFFVFLSELALAKPDWVFRLSVFDDGAFHAKIAEATLAVHNRFEKSPDAFLKETRLSVSADALVAELDTPKLRRLLTEGFRLRLIWQVKNTSDQQKFTEISKVLAAPKDVDALTGGRWQVPMKTKSLRYVGFLVYASKADAAFESKIEVRNERDSFYRCQ